MKARCYHGAFPHFMNGRTGETIPFWRKDDAADLVETSFLFMGLLCARQYFDRDTPAEAAARSLISILWNDVEWNWFTQGGQKVLYWHWSPEQRLGDGSPHPRLERVPHHVCAGRVFAALRHRSGRVSQAAGRSGRAFPQRQVLLRHELCRSACRTAGRCSSRTTRSAASIRAGLKDRLRGLLGTERASRAHQPGALRGQSGQLQRVTENPAGGSRRATTRRAIPRTRRTTTTAPLSPTAALSSLPYAPAEGDGGAAPPASSGTGTRAWGDFGFVDAFCESQNWYADTFSPSIRGPSS